MKKLKFIVVVCIAALFLLNPVIPAYQFSMVSNAQKEKVIQQVSQLEKSTNLKDHLIDFESVLKDISNSLKQDLSYSIFLDQESIKESNFFEDTTIGETALIFWGLFFYGMIFWILFKIIMFVLKDVGSFFGLILNRVTAKITNLFSLFLGLITGMFRLISGAIGGTFNVIVIIILSVLTAALGLVKLLVNIIVFILFGIVKLLGLTWRSIGKFIGLIFDIIYLIFESIFPNIHSS